MALSRRQKLTVISLLLYWPAIFVATHIPEVPTWVSRVGVSDKTLHYLAYLILVFLLWPAISPHKKVSWRRATVWWVLFVVVWYGAVDEWLQGYVGRSPDVMDFFADLAGALTTLVLFSIFMFWTVSLIVTGISIFTLTNFSRVEPGALLLVANPVFYLAAYAFFTMLWVRYIYHFLPINAPQVRWLKAAITLPTGLLLSVESFHLICGNGLKLPRIIICLAGIAIVILVVFITAILRPHFRDRFSSAGV